MAMACLYVAAKIEENCRRLRDIINVFHHLKQKRTGRLVNAHNYAVFHEQWCVGWGCRQCHMGVHVIRMFIIMYVYS